MNKASFPKLFSIVAVLSLLLPSNVALAADVQTTPQNTVGDQAILGLDLSPSSLPTFKTEKEREAEAAAEAQAIAETEVLDDKTPFSADPLNAVAVASATPPVSVADAAPLKGLDPAATTAAGDKGDQLRLLGGVNVSPDEAQGKIDDLTRQILLKEIELERFNLHYNLEVAKQGRWKGWRYAGFQEINSGMGLAGAIVSVCNRGSHLKTPKKLNAHIQEAANYIPMIGAIIGASAAGLEFMINEWHELQAARHGFSPGTAIKHVNGLKGEINSLLAQRDALCAVEATAPRLNTRVCIDQCEGKILRDLRDEGVLEFQRFHIQARKTLAFQQLQFGFDMAKYITNAIGYREAYLSLAHHHRYYNYRAGVFFEVSGGLTILGPIISRLYAKGVGEWHRYRTKETIEGAEQAKVEQLVADHQQLDQLCTNAKITDAEHPAVNRSAIYGLHEKTYQDEIASSEKARNKAKLTATQNIGAGLFVGGCKLASGILFIIPGHYPPYNEGKTFRSDHVTNDDLFAASVVAVPAGAYAMLDTLRIQVRGEINHHRLAKEGKLPKQLVLARLAQLDDMEARLKKAQ